MIVTISGYATAGKDTVADRLVARHQFRKTFMSKPLHAALLTLDPQVKITWAEAERLWPGIVSLDALGPSDVWKSYRACTELFGYDKSKTIEDYRRLLQRMGTEVGRDMFGDSIWLDKLVDECRKNEAEGANTVVTGVRFLNEVHTFVKHFTTSTWYVTRPGIAPALGHHGETQLSERECHETLFNDRTIEDLHERTDRLVDALLQKHEALQEFLRTPQVRP